MFKNIFTYLVYIILFWSCASELEPDSVCKINGESGRCVPARECLSANESLIKNLTLPTICWNKTEVHVCCATDNIHESSTATAGRPTDDCEPLTSVTAPEIGQKSWNKCLEYQEKIMRPCTDILLAEGKFRKSKCNRDSLALILESGVLEDEFPHMVLLGYGADINSVNWLCEGVIISERYILTFASCSHHREHGSVKYIRTGVVNMSDPVDSSRLFTVKRIIKHPSYRAPSEYYNIALLEIDNEIPLDLSALPACLDVGNLPSYTHAVVIGWPRTNREKSVLQKGNLFEAASSDGCVTPGYRNRFDKTIQTCYYNENDNKYDSGFEHILQTEHIKCMYVVIGLTFRRFNDYPGRPFTRVSAFVPWIESIVWT